MNDELRPHLKKLVVGIVFIGVYILFIFISKPQKVESMKEQAVITQGNLMGGGNNFATTESQSSSIISAQGQAQDNAVISQVKAVDNQQILLPSVTLEVDRSNQQNSFFALDKIVQNDERPENRLSAVNELRSMLMQNDLDSRIRKNVIEALRMATTDGDERVAAVASEAYKQVSN